MTISLTVVLVIAYHWNDNVIILNIMRKRWSVMYKILVLMWMMLLKWMLKMSSGSRDVWFFDNDDEAFLMFNLLWKKCVIKAHQREFNCWREKNLKRKMKMGTIFFLVLCFWILLLLYVCLTHFIGIIMWQWYHFCIFWRGLIFKRTKTNKYP